MRWAPVGWYILVVQVGGIQSCNIRRGLFVRIFTPQLNLLEHQFMPNLFHTRHRAQPSPAPLTCKLHLTAN